MSVLRISKLCLTKKAANCLLFRWNHHLSSANYGQTLLNLPETKITELDNGFRIATETTDTPVSTVGIWIDAGSRYETQENNGAGYFFEHLAFKGTSRRSRQNLEHEIASLGARFHSYTSREETAFYAKCLSSDAPKIVDILGDALTNIDLEESVIEQERDVVLRHVDEVENDLRKVTLDYLHLVAYQGTPLAKSVYGSSDNIKKFTKKDIEFYLRNSFIAPRMVLCASGNINHDDLVKVAEKQFSSVPLTYTGEIPLMQRCRFTGSEVRVREDWFPCAHIAIAVDTCGLNSPDVYPLMLAKTCVGSWNKASASSAETCNTLTNNVYKEKGCYSFESFHTLYRDCGLWGCYFVLNKMVIDDFIFNLQNEWIKLCINVTEQELALAKNILRTNLMLLAENSAIVCADMGKQLLFCEERISLDEIEENIEAVTLEQMRDVCLKYIYDRCPAVAGVGPIEGLTDYTRVRSGMYRLRY